MRNVQHPIQGPGGGGHKETSVHQETTGLHPAGVCPGLTWGLGSRWEMQPFPKWSVCCHL